MFKLLLGVGKQTLRVENTGKVFEHSHRERVTNQAPEIETSLLSLFLRTG